MCVGNIRRLPNGTKIRNSANCVGHALDINSWNYFRLHLIACVTHSFKWLIRTIGLLHLITTFSQWDTCMHIGAFMTTGHSEKKLGQIMTSWLGILSWVTFSKTSFPSQSSFFSEFSVVLNALKLEFRDMRVPSCFECGKCSKFLAQIGDVIANVKHTPQPCFFLMWHKLNLYFQQ